MKSLCFALALNIALCVALNEKEIGDDTQTQSRKVKHVISRVYSLPKARTGQKEYNQMFQILSGKYEMPDGRQLTETPRSDTPQNKEVTNSVVDNVGIKETELNAEMLNRIIQSLKGSNVSDLGLNQIRKGKLVIYYDDSTEKVTSEKTGSKVVSDMIRIENEIHDLFKQHGVPESIFYDIKKRVHVGVHDRIKSYLDAFMTFLNSTSQLNSKIINKVKSFIRDNNVDGVNVTSSESVGLFDLDTVTPNADASKSILESDVGTVTEKGVMPDVETLLDEGNATPISVHDPEVSATSSPKAQNTKTINRQEIVTSAENMSELDPSKVNTEVFEGMTDSAFGENVETPGMELDEIPRADIDNSLDLAKPVPKDMESVNTEVQDVKVPNITITGNNDGSNEDEANRLKSQLNHSLRTSFEASNNSRVINVPSSNMPIQNYIHYKNGKPFHIYVVFPELERLKTSTPGYETLYPTEKNHFHVASEDIIKSNNAPRDHELNSILRLINGENANQNENNMKINEPTPDKPSEIVLNILSKLKNSKNNDENSRNAEIGIVDEINNIHDTDKTGKKTADHILDVIEGAADQTKKNNDNINELMASSPNTNKPGHRSPKHGDEKLKELLLNAKQTLNHPDYENTRINELHDSNSNKNYLPSFFVENPNFGRTSEQEKIFQLIEELISRMKYLQGELDKVNMPKQSQRELLDKLVQKEILKIATDSVRSCVKFAKKSIELSIQKVLSESLE